MNLYYIRHGQPDYEHDSLTEEGKRQAELTGDYFSHIKLDRIISSPNGRAKLTAKYTADKQENIEIEVIDYLSENCAGMELGTSDGGFWTWIFYDKIWSKILRKNIGNKFWYKEPEFKGKPFYPYIKKLDKQLDDLFLRLNLKRNSKTNTFTPIGEVPENVAIFAHGGIGFEIIPLILGINYPDFACTFFEHKTCGITEIYIDSKKKSHPKMRMFSQIAYNDK